MFEKKDGTEYYSGISSHKYIDSLIKSSKNVLLVSPYIDEHYAHFLVDNSRGKNIKIISSSLDKKAEKILSRGVSIRYIVFGILFFGLANILDYFLVGINEIFIIGTAIFLLMFLLIYPKGSKIELRKPKGFVHAKFYIGEGEAIQGSANLTYNGMHKNFENISIIRDPEGIEKLRKEFHKLW